MTLIGSRWKSLCVVTIILFLLIGTQKPVRAASAQSFALAGNGTTTGYDVSGDRKPDIIRITHGKVSSGYQSFTITINGKTALRKKIDPYRSINAKLLCLKNGKKFFLISSSAREHDSSFYRLYRYKKGKLVCDVNLNHPNGSRAYFSLRKYQLNGNKIEIWLSGISKSIGRFRVTTTIKYKKGKLYLNPKKIYFDKPDKWTRAVGTSSLYTLTRDIQGYSSYTGKKKSVKFKKPWWVILLKYYPSKKGDRIYLRTYRGKFGWVNDVQKGWFNMLLEEASFTA